jgi:hypothetical protein
MGTNTQDNVEDGCRDRAHLMTAHAFKQHQPEDWPLTSSGRAGNDEKLWRRRGGERSIDSGVWTGNMSLMVLRQWRNATWPVGGRAGASERRSNGRSILVRSHNQTTTGQLRCADGDGRTIATPPLRTGAQHSRAKCRSWNECYSVAPSCLVEELVSPRFAKK